MQELSISEKENMLKNLDYKNHQDYKYKICAEPLQYNTFQDCYREQLVSLFQMASLMDKTVPLEEADYILYSNPTARVQDFTDSILDELEEINRRRKSGAEIIICGKATNIKDILKDKYPNITYVPSHYAKYVGNRFELDFKDEYVVYDERNRFLNIWPVDGCLNKCGFCRRTYMDIPFESQTLEFLKEKLDWFKENHPEQMKYVSLRAENLNQYGLDIDGESTLYKVIDLLNSYDEIEYISISIGFSLGETNEKLKRSLANCQKVIGNIVLYFETGSDRLLKMIGKKHTCQMAKEFIEFLRTFHPNIHISAAIMVGLPTEGLGDIESLGNLLMDCDINFIECNYYGYSPKHPLAVYPQLSPQLKEYHLKYLINYLKKHYDKEKLLILRHETFYDSSKRSVVKKLEKIAENQKRCKGRIWYGETYEYFCGDDNIIKSDHEIINQEELENEYFKVILQKRLIK